MRRPSVVALSLVGSLLSLGGLTRAVQANDGGDRHASLGANLLYLFPDPGGTHAGYTVLDRDMPGGADGDRAFRWAQQHAIAAVRLAAERTFRTLGPALYPMAIFDCSAENGDTPVNFSAQAPPRGRHPGDSHDGGINVDLGYFLRSGEGKLFSPDFSACTDHFVANETRAVKDAWKCHGPPDRLDVQRQIFFLTRLVALDLDLFGGGLVTDIGMDCRIKAAVLAKARALLREEPPSLERRQYEALRGLLTCDRWQGWARSHHHHVHVRFADLSVLARYRGAVRTLLARERAMDRRLDGKDPTQPWLRVRVLSQDLQRAVDMELDPGTVALTQIRFRAGDGPWHLPDPHFDSPRVRFDIPSGPVEKAERLMLTAELTDVWGTRRVIDAEVMLPRQDPRLAVRVDPARVAARYERLGTQWTLRVHYPQVYRHYVTEVSYVISRSAAEKTWLETHKLAAPDVELVIEDKHREQPIRFIAARVLLSSRKAIELPVFCAPFAMDTESGDG